MYVKKLLVLLLAVAAMLGGISSPAQAVSAPRGVVCCDPRGVTSMLHAGVANGVGPVIHDSVTGVYMQAGSSNLKLSLTPLDPHQAKLVQRYDAYASHTLYWSDTDSATPAGTAYGRVLYSISYPYLSVDQVWYDSNYSWNGSGPNLFGNASGDVWGGGSVLYRQWSYSNARFSYEFYWNQSYHVGTSTNPTEVLINGYCADGGTFSGVYYMWT